MANLALVTAGIVELLESVIQDTLGPEEDVAAGNAVRLVPSGTTAGLFTKGNATSAAEANIFGIALNTRKAKQRGLTAIRKGLMSGWDLGSLDFGAPIFLSATDGALTDTDPGTNEKVTLTMSGSPAGGTFTLTFGGQTTAAIAYNANAAAIQTALEALSSILRGNVVVTGTGPFTVEFINALGKQNLGAVTADSSSLTGGTSPSMGVAVATQGVHSVQVGRVHPIPTHLLGDSPNKGILVDIRN